MIFDPSGITFWGWLVIALVLLACELLAPFTFFLWLGASAVVTALIMFIFPDISWQTQFLIFSALSLLSVVISRKYLAKREIKTDLPNLNRRAQQYIGRVFTLSEAIEQGFGKINVDDSQWKVSGPPLDKGAEVRVTGADGTVFIVEPV